MGLMIQFLQREVQKFSFKIYSLLVNVKKIIIEKFLHYSLKIKTSNRNMDTLLLKKN